MKMLTTEQYFPRGGKKPKAQLNTKNKFVDFLATADKIGKKRRYKAPKIVTEEEPDEDDEHLSDSSETPSGLRMVSAEALTEKTIQVGMCILGRIYNVHDTKVLVSLPGRIYGAVMACHISEPYTKQLQAFVNETSEDVKPLSDMFNPGAYILVKVINIENLTARKNIVLSMRPQDVNEQYSSRNLREGMLIRGAVESVEDHGYIIDLGKSHWKAFLPQELSEENQVLVVGEIIWCVIKKCQSSAGTDIIKVTNKLTKIQACGIGKFKPGVEYTPDDLNPGMAVDFSIERPMMDGAEGTFLKDSTGYIHVSQIGTKIQTGKIVKARLLYTMPLTKLSFFTTKNIFANKEDYANEVKLKIGDIIDDAQVMKVTKKVVVFKIDNAVALMPLKTAVDNIKDLKELYSPGSTHKVRLLKYYLSDYAYQCTDSDNVLNEKYFSYDNVKSGDIVDATVESVIDKGIVVKVGKLNGWIPLLHASNAPQFSQNDDKKTFNLIQKKFQVNETVKTRILKVYPTQVLLTHKSDLLSNDFELLSEYEDAVINSIYRGLVTKHLPDGIIVDFFNSVRAIIPRRFLTLEPVKNIPNMFPLGQIVNCYVKSVDPLNRKMTCSLIDPKLETTNNNISKKKKQLDTTIEEDDVHDSQVSLNTKKSKSDKANIQSNEKIKKSKDKNGERLVENKKSLIEIENVTEKKSKKKKAKNENLNGFVVEDSEPKSKKQKKNDKTKLLHDSKVDEFPENTKKCSSEKSNGPGFSSINSFWNADSSTISKNLNNEENSSSDSDDEKVEEVPKKKKKLTAAEKVDKARQEEEKLRSIEHQIAANDNAPQSSDQFDRLLLANPNSSEIWIAYMAFHLQATEIEKARSIGRKAIKTVSFREEDERLNIWVAMLNLENRFGTEESLKSVLDEATQFNDSFSIHSKLLTIYVDTKKTEPLISLVDKMVAKYRNDPKTYILAGEACYKLNLVEKARSVMQKAMNRLDKKTYVPVLIKFAHMENNNGDSERAEALFEQIVSCLPQRVDVWSVYIDMLIKSAKYDNARMTFERAISFKLPAKKMKTLYKKWIEMEENFGDQEKVESVRRNALEYIKKNK